MRALTHKSLKAGPRYQCPAADVSGLLHPGALGFEGVGVQRGSKKGARGKQQGRYPGVPELTSPLVVGFFFFIDLDTEAHRGAEPCLRMYRPWLPGPRSARLCWALWL